MTYWYMKTDMRPFADTLHAVRADDRDAVYDTYLRYLIDLHGEDEVQTWGFTDPDTRNHVTVAGPYDDIDALRADPTYGRYLKDEHDVIELRRAGCTFVTEL